ncbi:MAG TPA: hypothetical protein VGP76_26230 [Planctomycetaceae bacterium]|nr:hypothetical protein [Planctomycetaceae bacterium]
MIRKTPALVALVALVGCAQSPAAAPIPLDQVPPSIMKISQEKLPDVKFDRAVKKADGGYEISGKDKKGKVHDVDLTATGEVTEVE